jgi:hypothetical protein
MILSGMEVIIGGKYAQACHYRRVVGKQAKITDVYTCTNPYSLKGKQTMCYISMPDNTSWEIHAEDCLPISNRHSKKVLAKYDD